MYQHAVSNRKRSFLLLFSSSLSHLPSLWVMFLSTVQPLQKNKSRCSVDEPKKCSAKNTTHNVRTQSTNITHLNACIRSIPNVRPLCICFAPYFWIYFFAFSPCSCVLAALTSLLYSQPFACYSFPSSSRLPLLLFSPWYSTREVSLLLSFAPTIPCALFVSVVEMFSSLVFSLFTLCLDAYV